MKTFRLYLLCSALSFGCNIEGTPMADDESTGEPGTSGGTSPTSGGPESTSETDDASTGDGSEILNCDVWAQDCPDGYKCMAYTDDGDYFTGTKCTPVVEDGGVAGDACHGEGGWSTGVDNCAFGHACWNMNPDTDIGACVALCTGTMDDYSCPDERDVCVFWVPGLAHVCLETCDPMLQNCPAGQSCGPNYASGGQEFVCYLDWSFEEGQEFDPCVSPNTCDPGLICGDPSQAVECAQDQYCCLSYCDLDDPSCAGEDAVCEPFYEAGTAPPEFANLGICGLPG